MTKQCKQIIAIIYKNAEKKRGTSHRQFKDVDTQNITNNNGVLFCRQVQLTHFYLLAGVGVN